MRFIKTLISDLEWWLVCLLGRKRRRAMKRLQAWDRAVEEQRAAQVATAAGISTYMVRTRDGRTIMVHKGRA